jgi:hypothetical protein
MILVPSPLFAVEAARPLDLKRPGGPPQALARTAVTASI